MSGSAARTAKPGRASSASLKIGPSGTVNSGLHLLEEAAQLRVVHLGDVDQVAVLQVRVPPVQRNSEDEVAREQLVVEPWVRRGVDHELVEERPFVLEAEPQLLEARGEEARGLRVLLRDV